MLVEFQGRILLPRGGKYISLIKGLHTLITCWLFKICHRIAGEKSETEEYCHRQVQGADRAGGMQGKGINE
jgi:hypothetical protein